MKKLNNIVVDPYLNDDMCIDRLVENWKLHNGIIIAFDTMTKDIGMTKLLLY